VTDPDRRLDRDPLLTDHPTALRASLALWVLGGFLFIALAVPALADIVQRVDDSVWELAVDLQNGVVVGFAEVLDLVGSTVVTLPLMVLVGVYLAWRRRWEALAYWALAMLASQVLIGPVKALYARPRPPLSLVDTSSFSFPSGHSVAGAAIAVSLVIVLFPAGPKRRNLEILAALFALAMALSRVYLRAHWLSDALAGAALGAAVAVGAAVLVHWIDGRRSITPAGE
jgi:undecaprenyl-diphosphatase